MWVHLPSQRAQFMFCKEPLAREIQHCRDFSNAMRPTYKSSRIASTDVVRGAVDQFIVSEFIAKSGRIGDADQMSRISRDFQCRAERRDKPAYGRG